MPANFADLNPEQPRRALRGFILAVHDFLDELVTTRVGPKGEQLFLPELVQDMSAAWSIERQRFSIAAERAGEASLQALAEHGLTGAPLRFKLSVVRVLHARYLELGFPFLRKLIKAIDDLLSSVLSAIGVNGAITEIKDAIVNSVDD